MSRRVRTGAHQAGLPSEIAMSVSGSGGRSVSDRAMFGVFSGLVWRRPDRVSAGVRNDSASVPEGVKRRA